MTNYLSFYEKYAPDKKSAAVEFAHTSAVLKIAKELAEKNSLDVDWSVAEPGALLHDIGVLECVEEYHPRVVKPYLQHAILGALIVRVEGFPEAVAQIVERHIGVGISAEEIKTNHYPLPIIDYLPQTLEEKLICYADKFHSSGRGFTSVEYRMAQYEKFGPGPVARFKALIEGFGIPEVR